MYSGGSGLSIDTHFVDIELSYDVLSPLPTLLSKHFNHPHPYIEIATAISDYQCTDVCAVVRLQETPQCCRKSLKPVGIPYNTDTLHHNSCFCSFSIPTSEIF